MNKRKIKTNAIIISDIFAFSLSFILGGLFGWLVHWIIQDDNYQYYNILLNGLSLDNFSAISTRAFYYSVICGFAILIMAVKGRYSGAINKREYIIISTQICIICMIADAAIQYSIKQEFSRLWLFSSWFFSIVVLQLNFYVTRLVCMRLGSWTQSVLLVGHQENVDIVEEELKFENLEEFQFSKFIISGERVDSSTINQVTEKVIRESERHDLSVFVPTSQNMGDLIKICHSLDFKNRENIMVPIINTELRRGLFSYVQFVGGLPCIRGINRLDRKFYLLSKRMMDLVGSFVALVSLSPVFLLLYLAVRSDGGPAFYGHTRVGRGEVLFTCWKFRSMHLDSDEVLYDYLEGNPEAKLAWEREYKLIDDPRITRLGAFIRKYSLDELPQVFNVVRGDMSLVGPRPVLREELDTFYGESSYYYTSVRPGITGLWQVSGRSDVGYRKRIDLDVRYVRTWSILQDLVILFRTIPAVIRGRGAF